MKVPQNVDLHYPGYWNDTDVSCWSVMGYCLYAVEKCPGISKQRCFFCLTQDLLQLEKLYPENVSIQQKVRCLRKEWKNNGKSVALMQFWKTIKHDMESAIMEKHTNSLLSEASSIKWTAVGLDIAANTIINANTTKNQKRDLEEPAAGATSSSGSNSVKRQHMTTANPGESLCLETDNIYVPSSHLSIGTVIKSRALTIHNENKEGKKLSNRERKIMVAGLSSILDLADNSMESQRSLFGDDDKEWHEMNQYFMNQFPLMPSVKLSEFINDTWTIICKVVENDQSIQNGLNYLYKLYGDLSLTKMDRNLLKIMEHILDLLDGYQHLLKKCNPTSLATEQDYYSILWSRIFQLLFPTNENIRVKSGESVSCISSKNKQEIYSASQHVIGFKVDARFIADVNNKEYDVATLELAKDDNDGKIIGDLGKLIREGKDNLDRLLGMLNNDSNDDNDLTTCYTYMIQLSGADCQLSTIHLASSGLYVVLPRQHFHLPCSLLQLSDFRDAMVALLTMKKHLNKTANRVIQRKQRRNSINDKLGRFSGKAKMNGKLTWRRGTWYTPSRNDLSALPDDFYGNASMCMPTIRILFQENKSNDGGKAAAAATDDSGDDATKVVVDVFGYRKHENGWLNIHTNKWTATHPLEKKT